MSIFQGKGTTDRPSDAFNYFAFKYWSEKGDHRVSHYPFLTSGPWTTLAVIGAYLYFVKVTGPRMMKSRQPMDLKQLMICYNFLMVALSGWMSWEAFSASNFTLNCWSCKESQRISSSTDAQDDILLRRGCFVMWVYLFSKFLEFSDTIFMILRKKDNQVSALHVIHHSIVPISVWFGAKFAPVSINLWFPFLNSSVHTFMYSYYGLMSLEASLSEKMKKKLFRLKPWMTRIQLIQFVLAIVHCAFMITKKLNNTCDIPYSYIAPNLGNGLLFLVLFSNFYLEAYLKKSSNKQKVRANDTNPNNGNIDCNDNLATANEKGDLATPCDNTKSE